MDGRGVREEIGLFAGRLLVVGHMSAESIAFDPEILAAELCETANLATRTNPLLLARVTAAIHAANTGETALCEQGRRV